MERKTHMAVGCAAALVAAGSFAPSASQSYAMLAVTAVTGMVGGVMADADLIDNRTSWPLPEMVELIRYGIPGFICMAAWFFMKSGGSIADETAFRRLLIYGVLWLLYIAVTVRSPHRGFSHSCIWAVIGTWLWTCSTSKYLGTCFVVAYTSHLLIDIMNEKGERLLFPLRHGFCLKLCRADGSVNKILLIVGVVLAVVRVGQLLA